MISVQKAIEIIQNGSENFGVAEVSFMESIGRVLAEDIFADRNFPAYDNVRMDGIALQYEAIKNGVSSFKIQAIQAAGSPALTLKDESFCIEVMTGSVLPKNADIVIQYEWISIENGVAQLNFDAFDQESLSVFKNIQAEGFDCKKDALILAKGTKITSADIGVLATVGNANVLVKKIPKIMIVSTGDEIVEVNEKPLEYQIRRSNVWTLVAMLKENGIEAANDHIKDDKAQLKAKIASHLENYDVLMFSGAVSKGKFDFLPEILEELGVEKLFHSVKQRPGKPFWFGKKGAKTVFAFPGNPVSTYVGGLKYFLPWYQKSIGLETKEIFATLAEDFSFQPNLHYFLSVKIKEENGKRMAFPIKGKGSGDLANLANVDAFLELPEDRNEFKKGEQFPVLIFRK